MTPVRHRLSPLQGNALRHKPWKALHTSRSGLKQVPQVFLQAYHMNRGLLLQNLPAPQSSHSCSSTGLSCQHWRLRPP